MEKLSAQAHSVQTLTLTIKAIGADVLVETIGCYEQTRSSLELDTTNRGVLQTTCGARQPILSKANKSVQGVVDLLKDADVRRHYFQGSYPSGIKVTSATYVDLLPLNVTVQGAIDTPGSTTTTVSIRFKAVSDGSSYMRFESAQAGDVSEVLMSTAGLSE